MSRYLILFVTIFALVIAACDSDNTVPNPPEPDASVAVCDPECGACQMCDLDGVGSASDPVCTDICATGTQCQDGQCVPIPDLECSPACGPCQQCNTTGVAPACENVCAEGLDCQDGQCVPPAVLECDPACAACQMCDTMHGAPNCVNACLPGQTCDAEDNVCRPGDPTIPFDHTPVMDEMMAGAGSAFPADVSAAIAAGKEITTNVCLVCHAQAGVDMIKTAHWKWLGPTPNLEGHETGEDVGKRNIVNNFCVAVPSNEGRCSSCHAGYGYTSGEFDFDDVGAIDCLVCHAAGYKKGFPGGYPISEAGHTMKSAASSVGKPTRATCGRCHFTAGGGPNVKKGDLGPKLADPTPAVDVHMGTTGNNFQCINCHVASAHKIPGQGVHLPVSEGRVDCVDCHGTAPHEADLYNNHAMDVACQTCHIPAFSRTDATKIDWDWSTAGNKDRGVETDIINGEIKDVYNYKKGSFIWEGNVRPTYGWYDGRVTRMTLNDSYAAGAGAENDRIYLGGPLATKDDRAAKIFPFKVMKGKQQVDTTTRRVLSPKLFGETGFWKNIPATYDPQVVENLWTSVLTLGAREAGQIGDTESFSGRATGEKPWDWAYTDMWMGINHEVAPASQALGCLDCHSEEDGLDWAGLGYTCDPFGADDPKDCGARN